MRAGLTLVQAVLGTRPRRGGRTLPLRGDVTHARPAADDSNVFRAQTDEVGTERLRSPHG